MSVSSAISEFKINLPPHVTLIAVSKTKPNELILDAYQGGQRDFGENKVQELVPKFESLPRDIRWHLIGHLQSNKVKYIAPFVYMIHSIDSIKLLKEVNKQALKCERVIPVLLQIFIAQEETKFGFSFEEARAVIIAYNNKTFPGIRIDGIMGMATNTHDMNQVRNEFSSLRLFTEEIQTSNPEMKVISMGMSSDWQIAVEEGSTMIRIGSTLFGSR